MTDNIVISLEKNKGKDEYEHNLLIIYWLIHGLFHIALVISMSPWYRLRGMISVEGWYQSRADDKGNMKKAIY